MAGIALAQHVHHNGLGLVVVGRLAHDFQHGSPELQRGFGLLALFALHFQALLRQSRYLPARHWNRWRAACRPWLSTSAQAWRRAAPTRAVSAGLAVGSGWLASSSSPTRPEAARATTKSGRQRAAPQPARPRCRLRRAQSGLCGPGRCWGAPAGSSRRPGRRAPVGGGGRRLPLPPDSPIPRSSRRSTAMPWRASAAAISAKKRYVPWRGVPVLRRPCRRAAPPPETARPRPECSGCPPASPCRAGWLSLRARCGR